MKFKEVMSKIAYLPANALTGLTNLILGSTVKETTKDGKEKVKIGLDGKPVTTLGLVGFIAEGIKIASRATADFLSNHKKAIATAAWLSLLAAGAVALTLFLWPAALTAVATFSVAGLSIAAIAGASTIAQIGLAAALTAAAVSAATYVAAAAGNAIQFLVGCCKGLRSKSQKSRIQELHIDDEEDTLGKDKGNDLGRTTFSGSNPYQTMSLSSEKRKEQPTEKRRSDLPPSTETVINLFPTEVDLQKKKGSEVPVVHTDETLSLSKSN